jgi:hypothetical protein
MGWLTVVLYFLAALGCWITMRMLSSEGLAAESANEVRAWKWITVAFVGLGINKQLDLQTALTEAGRMIASFQGWYDQRQPVQMAFIILITIICLVAAVVLVRWVRNAPAPTWLALSGSISVICYVLIRASSFHHVDRFIGAEVLGMRWNWILEIGGISVVLVASYWRRRLKSVQSRIYLARTRDFHGPRVQNEDGYTPVARKQHPTAHIWLTYSELSELLNCELSDVRQAVTDNEWSQRRSHDGRLRVKLTPALAHQFMLNYVVGLGHKLPAARPAAGLPRIGSMYLGIERRMNPRQQITKEAVICLERYSNVGCTVRDLSSAGVGLLLPDAVNLPAEFDLTFDHATRQCVTVWRRPDRMGVKLKGAASSAS